MVRKCCIKPLYNLGEFPIKGIRGRYGTKANRTETGRKTIEARGLLNVHQTCHCCPAGQGKNAKQLTYLFNAWKIPCVNHLIISWA